MSAELYTIFFIFACLLAYLIGSIPFGFLVEISETIVIMFGLVLYIIIWWHHRANIKRLLAGNEHQINF